MLDYAPQTFPMSSRRHAIKPEEAEYLTKALSGLCFTFPVQPLPQTQSQKDHAKADNTRTSSAADAFNFAPSTWTTTGPDMVNVADSQAGTACMHPNQQQKSDAAITAADDRWSSSRSFIHSRFDNKRKHAALSDEDDDMSSSPTAIDIVHPSELKFEEHVASHGLETRGRSPIQVCHFFYSPMAPLTEVLEKSAFPRADTPVGRILFFGFYFAPGYFFPPVALNTVGFL